MSAAEPSDSDPPTPSDLLERLDELLVRFEADARTIANHDTLDELRAVYLGRKRGGITAIFEGMRCLDRTNRRMVGQAANRARQKIEARLLSLTESLAGVQTKAIDVSLPGRQPIHAATHPITQTLAEIQAVFVAMGYQIIEGPEVESDWYNFEALNFPKDHPARDTQDTLVLTNEWMLRTHTSPVQIRFMETEQPPLAALFPGRVFRRDTPDATHTPMFVQCEGLVVDRDITMSDLKGTLDRFAKVLFGPGTTTRFRPGYFPFTEPSAELDATCPGCHGEGCRTCKGSGWVELLGSGMVHPKVLENVGYDPEEFQGFAFGMGIDRIAAVRYGIEDIRYFYDNDLRFLGQFRH